MPRNAVLGKIIADGQQVISVVLFEKRQGMPCAALSISRAKRDCRKFNVLTDDGRNVEHKENVSLEAILEHVPARRRNAFRELLCIARPTTDRVRELGFEDWVIKNC